MAIITGLHIYILTKKKKKQEHGIIFGPKEMY